MVLDLLAFCGYSLERSGDEVQSQFDERFLKCLLTEDSRGLRVEGRGVVGRASDVVMWNIGRPFNTPSMQNYCRGGELLAFAKRAAQEGYRRRPPSQELTHGQEVAHSIS